MWLESVALPAPAIGQDLRIWGCGEQLSVEELIPEPSVGGFRESVLPGRSRRDVGRAGGCAGLTPVPYSLGNELRTVVAPDERPHWIEAAQLF